MRNSTQFLNAVRYCCNISWNTSPFYTIIRLCLSVFGAIIPFVVIFASKKIMDMFALGQSTNWKYILVLLIIIGSAGLFLKISNLINQYVLTVHNDLLTNAIDRRLMKKTLNMDIAYFDSPNYLDALQAVTIDSMAITNIIWNIIYGVSSIVSCTVAFISIFSANWLFSMMLLISAIPSTIIQHKYTKALYTWRLDHFSDERKLGYIKSLTYDRSYAGEIRLLNLNAFFLNRYQTLWKHCFSGRKHVQRKYLVLSISAIILPEVLSFLFILNIIYGITRGSNTIGDYTLFTGLSAALISNLYVAITSIAAIYDNKLKIDTFQKFERHDNHVQDTGKEILSDIESVQFVHVTFTYPNSLKPVLNDVTFTIHEKEKVCLIGVNGAGKSTVIKLLLRFYDVDNGEILINERNIKNFTLDSLYRCFSVFFQDYVNYAFTLRDNICLSSIYTNHSDRSIVQSLHLAGAEGLLKKMPAGLDTFLKRVFDQNGYEASGGEYQKIALARAIHRNGEFIIFDEPSSSLDPKSELQLYQNIQNIWQDKMALLTSHRLSVTRMADYILLLENGSILEQGTHKQLMELNQRYAELFTIQASKYMSDDNE